MPSQSQFLQHQLLHFLGVPQLHLHLEQNLPEVVYLEVLLVRIVIVLRWFVSSVFVVDVISDDGFICRDIQLHRWVYLVAHPPLHPEACLELVSRIYSSSSR